MARALGAASIRHARRSALRFFSPLPMFVSDSPPGSLGAAFSVSVIEHIAAEARRLGLARVAEALAPGGPLVVTVDLFPGTKALWNYCVGLGVEPVDKHGTIVTEADPRVQHRPVECAHPGRLRRRRRGACSEASLLTMAAQQRLGDGERWV
jgi:hypothetical protein